jgi:hypothetical protein
MSADLKVVQLHQSTLRDVPAKLRMLAEAIERGDHGHVSTCAIALLGDTMECLSFGDDSSGPSAAVLFQAAAMRIVREVEQAGR